jgi:hypothetical protein
MSDQQEPKPTARFGSVQQQRETIEPWKTVGGGKSEMSVDALTQKRQDVKTSAIPPSCEEMKRQTVYIPKPLATWLKVHAAIINDDISGIITRLVEQYRDEVEGKNQP